MTHRAGHQPETSPVPVLSYTVLQADSIEALNALVAEAVASGLTVIGSVTRGPTGAFLQAMGEGAPVSTPGGSYAMLLATGTNSGDQQTLVPLSFNTSDGIGAAVGSSFSLSGIGYPGKTDIPAPLFAPGYMFLAAKNTNESPFDAAVLAFSLSASGLTKVPGELAMDAGDTNATFPPGIALAPDGKVYAFADDSTGAYVVRAGEISGGTFVAVGNPLTGDLPSTGGSKAARVIDGHLCVAVSDSNDGINHAELHSFAFDGTNWTVGTTLDLSGAYSGWLTLPGCIIGIRSTGRIIDVFTYTAASGFSLAWSLDPATLSPTYDQPDMWFADQATGYLWFGLSDAGYTSGAFYVLEPNFGTSQFDLVASLEDIGQHRLYALALYGDVLFCNDSDYNGTYAHVRTGNALGDALPGGLTTYDSAVPLPLLEA